MTTVNIPYLFPAAIQVNRWVRNGLVVDAHFQTGLANVANQIARWRTKEVFRAAGAMGFDASGADVLVTSRGGEGDRWRFAFHTGPFAKSVTVRWLCCQQSTTDPANPYARLRVLTTGGATVGDGTFYFGNAPGSSNLPSNYGVGNSSVAVSPSTDYTAVISDFDGMRVVAATVYEQSLDPDTSNGYITTGYAAQMPIYDTDRSDPMTIARSMWLDGGAHLFNWSVDVQSSPQTNALLTYKNAIDNLSTGVDSTTPGCTLDLTNSDRISESGVPVVLKVYGKWGGASGTGGTVRFRNGSGTVSQTVTGFGTTAGWQSATFTLPALRDKYDLQFASTSGGTTFSLYAASLYQKGT